MVYEIFGLRGIIMETETIMVRNAIQCLKCNDIIESKKCPQFC